MAKRRQGLRNSAAAQRNALMGRGGSRLALRLLALASFAQLAPAPTTYVDRVVTHDGSFEAVPAPVLWQKLSAKQDLKYRTWSVPRVRCADLDARVPNCNDNDRPLWMLDDGAAWRHLFGLGHADHGMNAIKNYPLLFDKEDFNALPPGAAFVVYSTEYKNPHAAHCGKLYCLLPKVEDTVDLQKYGAAAAQNRFNTAFMHGDPYPHPSNAAYGPADLRIVLSPLGVTWLLLDLHKVVRAGRALLAPRLRESAWVLPYDGFEAIYNRWSTTYPRGGLGAPASTPPAGIVLPDVMSVVTDSYVFAAAPPRMLAPNPGGAALPTPTLPMNELPTVAEEATSFGPELAALARHVAAQAERLAIADAVRELRAVGLARAGYASMPAPSPAADDDDADDDDPSGPDFMVHPHSPDGGVTRVDDGCRGRRGPPYTKVPRYGPCVLRYHDLRHHDYWTKTTLTTLFKSYIMPWVKGKISADAIRRIFDEVAPPRPARASSNVT